MATINKTSIEQTRAPEEKISIYDIFHSNKQLNIEYINVITDFLSKVIDKDGNINVDDKFSDMLIDVLKTLLLIFDVNMSREYVDKFFDKYANVFDFNNTTKCYHEWFIKTLHSFNNLVFQSLFFETVNKMLAIIFIFGTTDCRFEAYMERYKSLYDLNGVEEYQIKEVNRLCEAAFHNVGKIDFNSLSYQVLSMGHLKYRLREDKQIIIENPILSYGRITLQLIKCTNCKSSKIESIFDDIFNNRVTPSTPVFYNALTKDQNLLTSCFIINCEDNIESIAKGYEKAVSIQKYNSGIGIVMSAIRDEGRPVMKGFTKSNGITPYINSLSETSLHFKNYIRNRSSNINVVSTITSNDVKKFLRLKQNSFIEDKFNAQNIFQTLEINDEFMYRLVSDSESYLISAEQTIDTITDYRYKHLENKRLTDVYGQDYSDLYNMMVKDDKIEKEAISSKNLFSEIVSVMIETGGPFLLFKDIINYTSNHKNFGIIKGTNLCTEIFEYSDDEETACCNIMSLNLKNFVDKENKIFDFNLFEKTIRNTVFMLNNTIDTGLYSHISCKKSNLSKRPIGIGIQGLANMFYELGIKYTDGKAIYKNIVEFMYYTALDESCNLAATKTFNKVILDTKTPLEEGKFSFNLFLEFQSRKKEILKNLGSKLHESIDLEIYKPRFISNEQWQALSEKIKKDGMTNTLVLAFMPTSLSSVIFGNCESFEPYSYNIFKRSISNQDIVVYNPYLVKDLINSGELNNENVLSELIKVNGNIKSLNISESLKNELLSRHLTVYDIDVNEYIQFHAEVNAFVDQGKSYNVYIPRKNNPKQEITHIISALIYNWLLGRKSIYYYRTQTTVDPIVCEFKHNDEEDKTKNENFDKQNVNNNMKKNEVKENFCSLRKNNEGECFVCSS